MLRKAFTLNERFFLALAMKEEVPEKEGPETPPDSPLLDLSDAAIKKLIRSAKKRGYVTHDQINSLSKEVNSEQIEDVLAMFSEMGVNVVETEEATADEEQQADEEPDDHVAVGPAGAVAWSAGKTPSSATARVQRNRWPWSRPSARSLSRPRAVRLAIAHYGGASLWFPNAKAEPDRLEWKGSHLGARFSPDGRFLVTSMQEPALHGWRLDDKKDMRMSGYGARVRSVDWTADGKWLATSGATQLVLWPFSSKDGPMGKQPQLRAPSEHPLDAVACHPKQGVVAVGFADGLVLLVRTDDGAESSREEARRCAGHGAGLERNRHAPRLRNRRRRGRDHRVSREERRMYLRLTRRSQRRAGGPRQLPRLQARDRRPSRATSTPRAGRSAKPPILSDPDTAWICAGGAPPLAWVAEDAVWQQSFSAMIEKARPHGWIDEGRQAIKAHVEWMGSTGFGKRTAAASIDAEGALLSRAATALVFLATPTGARLIATNLAAANRQLRAPIGRKSHCRVEGKDDRRQQRNTIGSQFRRHMKLSVPLVVIQGQRENRTEIFANLFSSMEGFPLAVAVDIPAVKPLAQNCAFGTDEWSSSGRCA